VFDRLWSYLDQAQQLMADWRRWLEDHERLILSGEARQLESHALESHVLEEQLSQLAARRQELLNAAGSGGYRCATLKQLAQRIPQWTEHPELRNRFQTVERALQQLSRAHTAAWVLVSQCARHVDETLMLMSSGSTTECVYISTGHADTHGGHILDTQV
jgi:flagellar biosynthesis/type III secretory pathway chaperone